jgi:hypothetical protein
MPMNNLEKLATRLRDDPFFLACPLAIYADSMRMDDAKLSAALGCPQETLIHVRLCRAPSESQFIDDIGQIASRFQLNADALAQAVRGGQVIFQMRQANNPHQKTLLAARDLEEQDLHGEGEGAS